MTLARLEPGQSGVVEELKCDGLPRRRLLDLGFVPGTEVEAVMRSPGGDPTAYRVRGAMIALRSKEAKEIDLEGGVSPS